MLDGVVYQYLPMQLINEGIECKVYFVTQTLQSPSLFPALSHMCIQCHRLFMKETVYGLFIGLGEEMQANYIS